MIGIVIVTHGELGTELLRTAQEIVGKFPSVEAVSVQASEQIDKARKKIEAALQRVSDGSGVLILTALDGVDDRVRNLVDLELSVGDYVESGGEIPALAVIFLQAHSLEPAAAAHPEKP